MKFILMLVVFLIVSCSQLPQKRTDKLSIVQGVTNAKQVEFSVVAPRSKLLTFELHSDKGQVLKPEEVKVIVRDHSTWAVHKIIFVRDPGPDYNLYAFEGLNVVDQRLIGRVPESTSRLRIAIASCMKDHYPERFRIWDQVAIKRPDYLLLIGDNVYADKDKKDNAVDTNPQIIWDRYVDVRLTLPLFFQTRLIPIHALWDDHDFGKNDADSSFVYKKESREIFEAFWAQDMDEESFTRGFGVGGLLTVGDFNFYFLDGRTFRSPDTDGKHLGHDQHAWLLTKLSEEPSPSFIVKGDQFFGGYAPTDSFERKHPKDFAQFTNDLAKISTPFVFLSGDRHFSEIMQFPRGLFGKPSFEITSSSIHSGMAEDKKHENPWRVVIEQYRNNFIMIDNMARDNHWFMDIESIGRDGEVYFRREVAVFIKDLQNNLDEVRKKRRSGERRYRRIRNNRR